MLNLEAYSGKDKQHVLQILTSCVDDNLDILQCIKILENSMPMPGEQYSVTRKGKGWSECPSCGKQAFKRRLLKDTKMNVMWCYSCAYSEEIK